MESDESNEIEPSCPTAMDPSTSSVSHLTIEGSLGPQHQPGPQQPDHLALSQSTLERPRTPINSHSESVHSVADPHTPQPCDSADLQPPSLTATRTRQGRASKRIATFTPRKGAKKPRNDSWPENAEKMLANPKASIYKQDFDLKSVLLHEKTSSILPQGTTSFAQLSSQELNTAVASFKEDGRGGRHDPEWVRQALNASARRAAGEFDSYEASKFQETWGEDNPEFSDSDESDDEEKIEASRNSCQPSPKYGSHQDDEDEGSFGGSGSRGFHNNSNQASSKECTQSSNLPLRDSSTGGQTGDASSTGAADQLLPPPKWQITYITGDGKFEALFRLFPFIAAPLIQIGDVIRLVESNMTKDVIVKDFHGCPSRRNHLPRSPNHFPYLEIAIPPKGYAISEPYLREDIIFPNETVSTWITGLVQVFHALRVVEPNITTPSEASWENYEVYRQDILIGTVFDLRQAWHFAKNEHDFKCQLNFEGGRRRRLHRSQHDDGYHLFPNSGLYRKVQLSDVAAQNHCLIIELGEDLNQQLAACAVNGFIIVMYDYRILNNDGIPLPRNVSLQTAYEQGPHAFPTQYTREVACIAGWTKGHAHIGPLGLGKGWKGPQWSKGRARPESSDGGKSQRASDGWLGMGSIAFERCPSGHPWTKQEIFAVGKFHETMIVGKLRHFPLPRTKVLSYTGIIPDQLGYDQDPRKPINGVERAHQTRYQKSIVSQSGLTKAEQREPSIVAQASIPSLPSGDARLAIASLFKKDPRRSSMFDERLTLEERAFNGIQPDLQLPMDFLASTCLSRNPAIDQSDDESDWEMDSFQELGSLVVDKDKSNNYVDSHLRSVCSGHFCLNRRQVPAIPCSGGSDLKEPRTKIKKSSPKESQLDEVPWYESASSSAASGMESDFPNSVHNCDVIARLELLENADNPDSKHEETPNGHVLEDARLSNKEREGICYLATYDINDGHERLFLDAPYPPPTFASYFSSFDGSSDHRDHSQFTSIVKPNLSSQPFDFNASFELKFEAKVQASLLAQGSEDQSSAPSIKHEFEQVLYDSSAEFAEGNKRYDLQTRTVETLTTTQTQPSHTCKSNHPKASVQKVEKEENEKDTEYKLIFIDAAECLQVPTIQYNNPLLARGNTPLRFYSPANMDRYRSSPTCGTHDVNLPFMACFSQQPALPPRSSDQQSTLSHRNSFQQATSTRSNSLRQATLSRSTARDQTMTAYDDNQFSAGFATNNFGPAVSYPTSLSGSSHFSPVPLPSDVVYKGPLPKDTRPVTPNTAKSDPVINLMSISHLLSSKTNHTLSGMPVGRPASYPLLRNSELTSLVAGGTLINHPQYASPYTDNSLHKNHAISAGHVTSSTMLSPQGANAGSAAVLISSRLPLTYLEPSVSSKFTSANKNIAESHPSSTQVGGRHHFPSDLVNLPLKSMLSHGWQGGCETIYTPAAIFGMNHRVGQRLLVKETKTTFIHGVTIKEAESLSAAEYLALNTTIRNADNVDDAMTTNETEILTPEQQRAFLEANFAQAIWFDQDRRPAGIRTTDFSQPKPSSSLTSAYPNPDGFLSLPHYPNFLCPLSATPSVVAPSSAPAPALPQPKRRKLWENEEYIP